MNVRPIDLKQDTKEWFRMRKQLWPDLTDEENLAEVDVLTAGYESAVFVCERPGAGLCGFLEMSTRTDYVEGCDTSPVAYIEGWYVDDDMRHKGLGGRLVAAGEEWAHDKGLSEIGSDAEVSNEASILAHQKLGYSVVSKNVHFRKRICYES